jgi:Arc/MetJ-type ribon-helix-helix transcriptional regulator
VIYVYIMSPRTSKRPKGDSHSVRIDKELDKWVEARIESKQFGSWSHAIEWGLTVLREKLETKK